jgi:hypothetical protein
MVKISQELVMKAAKFVQNHKIKADIVVFNSDCEVIGFEDETEKTVAWVGYNNARCQTNYWIERR